MYIYLEEIRLNKYKYLEDICLNMHIYLEEICWNMCKYLDEIPGICEVNPTLLWFAGGWLSWNGLHTNDGLAKTGYKREAIQ